MTGTHGGPPVVLLGPQRFQPAVAEAAAALGIEGTIATVTAGWQEREDEDQELHEHLGGRTVNLRLYARAEEVLARDPTFREAHRQRQGTMRHKQDFYRVRLEHELAAAHVINQRQAPDEILAEEQEASIQAIRELDAYHLGQCQKVREDFEARWRPRTRPAVAEQRQALAEILSGCAALAIAGGQVATLVNRLDLFGIDELAAHLPILAWSAGAMAISERIVLFHDHPPQGQGAAEILDSGLGLARGVVPLPHADSRLFLDDAERVATMARRFAPARCLALADGTRVVLDGQNLRDPQELRELCGDGRVRPVVENGA